MNIYDLTITQLRRAAAIKEQIDHLNKELGALLGASAKPAAAARASRTMSASAKKKIAAAQKARWANLRQAKPATPAKHASKATNKKKRVSQATRAKLRAKLKAYWAAKRAGNK